MVSSWHYDLKLGPILSLICVTFQLFGSGFFVIKVSLWRRGRGAVDQGFSVAIQDSRMKVMSRKLAAVVCLVATTFLAGVPSILAEQTPIVQMTDGPVQGLVENGVSVFRGIPFAAPPVLSNRFRAPQPVIPWNNTFEAYFDGPICPQVNIGQIFYVGNEDCLHLSVYVPPGKGPFPVMVWFYGGMFILGDQYEFGYYDGSNIAKKDVILVAGNYRLGSLGYVVLEELQEEDPDHSSGNYGNQDQQAVLRWVQRNIRAFGGNPKQVTIFGESAGAISVWWHLVSPTSAGLFSAAISESGGEDVENWFFFDYEKQKEWCGNYLAALGCDRNELPRADFLTCIRNLPVADVMEHTFLPGSRAFQGFVPPLYPFMAWAPVIDGSRSGVLKLPFDLLRQGKFNHVPVLAGTNHDEGDLFVPLVDGIPGCGTFPLSEDGLRQTLVHVLQKNITVINQLLQFYQHDIEPPYKTPDAVASAAIRDFAFLCSSRRGLREMASHDPNNGHYLYRFDYKGDWVGMKYAGDYHSSELPFVWNNPWPPILHMFSKRDAQMARIMNTAWTNFAKSHDPNLPESLSDVMPAWPRYNETQFNLVLAETPRLEQNLFQNVCTYLDGVFGYELGEQQRKH